MKKYFLFLLIVVYSGLFAQEKIINQSNLYGEITDVKENGNFVSVKYYDKLDRVNTAALYNKEGKEVLKIKDKEHRYIRFAEYIPSKNIYLVIFEGWEGYQNEPMEWDKIKAFDINTGNKLWEANSNALYYEVSPSGSYLTTKSSTDDDERSCQFEVFTTHNGSKIYEDEKLENFRATWFDDNKVVVVFNETERVRPQYLIKEQDEWEAKWEKLLGQKFADYAKKKISKNELDKYEDEAINEKHKTLNEFASRITKETKIITTSRLKLINVESKRDEYNIIINNDYNKNFILNLVNNNMSVLNVDIDKNIYVLGYLADGKIEKQIHQFIKYDNNLNLSWKSQLLPLTAFTKYTLEQKPYFGYVANNIETFIEPSTGSLVAFGEVQKKFNSIPSITSFRKKFESYLPMQNFKIELQNENAVLKSVEVK